MSNTNDSLPIGSAEDVEYSEELADRDDKEAAERAEAAERRVAGEESD